MTIEHRASGGLSRRQLVVGGGVVLALFGVGALGLRLRAAKSTSVPPFREADLERVLTRYMRYMAARDTQAAAELYSARTGMDRERLKGVMGGPYRVAFDGYFSLTLKRIEYGPALRYGQKLADKIMVRVWAEVLYLGGHKGELLAVLEQEGAEWKILKAHVVVSAEKGGAPSGTVGGIGEPLGTGPE